MNDGDSIIWRRLDIPGHESARVYGDKEGWYLDGAAIFLYEQMPCRLEYLVQCDPNWQTAFVSIDGWIGDDAVEFEIEVNQGDVWSLEGHEVPAVEGCMDIDLNFSPVTNLLPLRRLNLAVGESRAVRSAWLTFPSFELKPLEQVYTRVNETTVRYESDGGKFVRNLRINDSGLVVDYPDHWTNETTPNDASGN